MESARVATYGSINPVGVTSRTESGTEIADNLEEKADRLLRIQAFDTNRIIKALRDIQNG